jgi:PAS domain S-box-containing protein
MNRSSIANKTQPLSLAGGSGGHDSDHDDAQARARYERALAGSHDGFWERDLRTGVSWYSPSFRALFGFAPHELPNDEHVRDSVNSRIHPDDVGAFLAANQHAIDTLGSFSYEVRFRDRHDRWRWVRGSGKVWAGPDGRAAVIAGNTADVHEEKIAQQALAVLSRRFERAVLAADEAVFERTVGSDELYVSDRFAELLGRLPGQMPRQRSRVLEWIHPEDRPRFDADNEAGLARLGRWTMNYRLLCSDGDYRWFREHAVAERDAAGQVRVTGVIADIHEQVLAHEQLEHHQDRLEGLVQERTARLEAALALAEQQRAEADRANQAKSLFLAHMSHEIRTPLNGVLGLTELALSSCHDDVQRRYLQLALQSGRSLLHVINDVLDFSRIEAGKLALREQPFDLADTVAEAMRGVTSLRASDVRFMYDYIGEHTAMLGDETRVRQVLTNLLGNAVKFTQAGHVTVSTLLREEGPGLARAEIEVSDTGIGMDTATLGRVFDPFVQGDDSVSRRHGGTGLGLSIAQGLAQSMGGSIEARSQPGAGSCFTLSLPLRLDPAGVPLPRPAPGGHAWLVYPVEAQARWTQRRFVRLGWTTRTMTSLDEALNSSCREPLPDLVMLPGHLSRDTEGLARLRAALPEVQIVIAMRADWHLKTLEQLAGSLAIDIALAPLTPHDLLRITAPRAAAPVPAVAAAAPEAGAPAWTGRTVLLVEDNPVNRLIGEEMLASLGLTAESVDSGAQALARCRARAPDLMLLDVQMPEMDGYETCRRLRAWQVRGEVRRFPIVALTAHAMQADRDAARRAGMDGFLTKPIDLATLRAELERWLQHR